MKRTYEAAGVKKHSEEDELARSTKFSGPVFIVGMPRSGTKLLRDLLNNHSAVGLAPNESHFIPYYYRRLERFKDLTDLCSFDRFFRDVHKSTFYRRLDAAGLAPDAEPWYERIEECSAVRGEKPAGGTVAGSILDPAAALAGNTFAGSIPGPAGGHSDGSNHPRRPLSTAEWSYATALRVLYQWIADQQGKRMWGDKTPSYLLHIPLLKRLFPGARFIHIVRDVRDVCLSTRSAMGKNLFRAAQRWHDHIEVVRRDAAGLAKSEYLEVSYETLVNVPERVLRRCCDFLEIEFEPEMAVLHRPSENLGVARGSLRIVNENTGRWRTALRAGQIQCIERLGMPLMAELGYRPIYRVEPARLAGWRMKLYKMLDGLNLLRFHLRSKTIRDAMRFIRIGVRLSAKKGYS